MTSSHTIPDALEKKADKVISKFYETENFSKQAIAIPEAINLRTLSEFNDENLFKITTADNFLGYGYIGSALGKAAAFDYIILFDSDFIITKSKVLIYREEYGGEIGSKRWLKQFIGKSSNTSELIYGETIVPISGATISVKSMTNAINNLFKSIKLLQDLKII